MVERADTVEESDANENATCYHENLMPNNSQTTIGIENDFQNIRIPEGIKFDWTESKIGILQGSLTYFISVYIIFNKTKFFLRNFLFVNQTIEGCLLFWVHSGDDSGHLDRNPGWIF